MTTTQQTLGTAGRRLDDPTHLVLDPDDDEQMKMLSLHVGRNVTVVTAAVRHMLDQPPLVDEPTDPAIRVADHDGDVWVAYDGRWYCLTTPTYTHRPGHPWTDLVRFFGPLQEVAR